MASRIIRTIISTAKAPRSASPYNQAIVVDRTVYLSGVLGIDKDTGKLVKGGAVPEAAKALENIQNILSAAGSKVENVVKCTVLLNDIADFGKVNEEYIKGIFLSETTQFQQSCLWFCLSLPQMNPKTFFSLQQKLSNENLLPSWKTPLRCFCGD